MRIKNNSVPLFLPLIAVISGIVIGLNFKNLGLNLFLCSGLLLFVISIYFHKKSVFIFSIIFLAASSYIYHTIPSQNDISQILPFEGKVTGRVLLPARHLIVRVDKKFSGKVYLQWEGSVPSPGARIEIYGRFYSPRASLNPGQFNWRKHLANQKIFTVAQVYSIRVIKEGFIAAIIGKIRSYIKEKIYKYLPRKEAGILAGILLGNPGLVPQETIEQFRKSGIMHILAVSGLHVGLVLFTVYYVLAAFGLRKNRSFIIAIIFMYIYVVVTGMRPSACRAAIMLTMVVAGGILGTRGNVYNSLCLAALVILGLCPGLLFTAGFILSFLAVSGIVYISPSLYRLVGRPFAVSISAVAVILPVLAWNYNYLPLFSPITNLVVIPLTGIVVSLGMFFLVISGFSNFLGEIYSIAIFYVIRFIELITGICPGGVTCGRHSLLIVAIFYFILILVSQESSRRRNILLIISLAGLGLCHVKDRYFGKSFLAVLKSKGGCISVIKESCGDVIAFIGKKDIDEKVIKSSIYSFGIRKIKHIYIVHPPYEDLSGVFKLAEEFKVKKIFYPPHPFLSPWGRGLRRGEKVFTNETDICILKKGDVIYYKKSQIIITEPDKTYLDIRDNFIQAEFLGKSKIFIYAGGDIPKNTFDVIMAIEPYKPDWENIKSRCKGLIVYYGEDTPPEIESETVLLRIKDKGRIFPLQN